MAKRKLGKVNQRKDFMGGKSPMKYIIIPCMIVVIMSCMYLIWYQNNLNSTASNIEYIKSFMSSSGELRDYSNKIGMHDPKEDIRWYKTDDSWQGVLGDDFLFGHGEWFLMLLIRVSRSVCAWHQTALPYLLQA